MSASDIPSETKVGDRSIAPRPAARVAKFERERLIVDCLNRGVTAMEIAARLGVTEKRMRALAKGILGRRIMLWTPEEFAAVQANRLSEALLVAYSAMSPENLQAVSLVVRIVRELDRYNGFAAGRRPHPRPIEAGARAEPVSPATPPGSLPMASQASENVESAPGNGTPPTVSDASAWIDEKTFEAPAALAPQHCGPTPAASPAAGWQMAPETIDKIEFARGQRAPGAKPAGGAALARMARLAAEKKTAIPARRRRRAIAPDEDERTRPFGRA